MLQQMQMNPQSLSTLSPPVTCFHYYSTFSHKNTKRLNGIPIQNSTEKCYTSYFSNSFHQQCFLCSTLTLQSLKCPMMSQFYCYTCCALQKFWYNSPVATQ